MLESLFKAVLHMSTLGSIISLLLMIAKPLTKRIFGHRWNYYIQVVIMLIMLVPFSVNVSPKAVRNKITYENLSVQTDTYRKLQNVNFQSHPETKNDTIPQTESNISWLKVLSRIWIIFAGFVFLVRIIQYRIFILSLKRHCEKGEKAGRVCVKYTDLLYAPLTVGLFKKTILIPQNMRGEENEKYILKHELTHIKNKDIPIKWLCTLLKTVHWFNPAVYYISNKLDRECEYVCDIRTTENMNDDEKKQYMNTILSCLYKSHSVSSVFTTRMAESKSDIVKRFEIIVSHQKQTLIKKAGCFCMFIIFMGISISVSAFMGAEAYDKNMPSIEFSISSNSDKKTVAVQNRIPEKLQVSPIEKPFGDGGIKSGVIEDKPETSFNSLHTEPIVGSEVNESLNSQENYFSPSEISSHVTSYKQNDVTHEDNITSSNNDNSDFMYEDNSEVTCEDNSDSISEPEVETPQSQKNSESDEAEIIDDVSYPGDLAGYITFEDWSSEKMLEDLKSTGCLCAGTSGMQAGSSYVYGEISYENGNSVTLSNITPSDKGRMCVYLDSEYQQLISVAFIFDGKQISASLFVPDGETFYVFAGFDPSEKYDIIISNPNGSTWKTTAEYVVC